MQALTAATALAFVFIGVGAWCLSVSLVLACVLAGNQPRPIADKVFLVLYRAGWIALVIGGALFIWSAYR